MYIDLSSIFQLLLQQLLVEQSCVGQVQKPGCNTRYAIMELGKTVCQLHLGPLRAFVHRVYHHFGELGDFKVDGATRAATPLSCLSLIRRSFQLRAPRTKSVSNPTSNGMYAICAEENHSVVPILEDAVDISSTTSPTLPHAHQKQTQSRNLTPQPYRLYSGKNNKRIHITNPNASNSQKEQKVQQTFVVQQDLCRYCRSVMLLRTPGVKARSTFHRIRAFRSDR